MTTKSKRLCSFPDCEGAHSAKGLCGTHYNQQRAGKELTVIGTTRGRQAKFRGPDGDYHGTSGGYSNHTCRCTLCVVAWNAYCAGRKAARVGKSREEKEGIRQHGIPKSYQYGCRCTPCTDAHTSYTREKKYLLNSDEYATLLKKSNGTCMCCGKEDKLVMDHCHISNKIRGLLCTSCNTGIGKLGDSLKGVRQALDYLTLFEVE